MLSTISSTNDMIPCWRRCTNTSKTTQIVTTSMLVETPLLQKVTMTGGKEMKRKARGVKGNKNEGGTMRATRNADGTTNVTQGNVKTTMIEIAKTTMIATVGPQGDMTTSTNEDHMVEGMTETAEGGTGNTIEINETVLEG